MSTWQTNISFIKNYATGYDIIDSVLGGAIVNNRQITDLHASFNSNYGNAKAYNAFGGAVYNKNYINNIQGDFSNNYVIAEQNGSGGAIDNESQIYTIVGRFENNYVQAMYENGGEIFRPE